MLSGAVFCPESIASGGICTERVISTYQRIFAGIINDTYLWSMINGIQRLWFEAEWIYMLGDDGKSYRQSLLWYDRLMNATDQERSQYEISTIGIHWPNLDIDISFESFEYQDAEPTRLQRFFLTHPEINVAGFAKKYGYNASLIRSYINGFKTPSSEKEAEILACISALGKEYMEY